MFKTVIKFNSDSNNTIESILLMFQNTNLTLCHNVGEIVITDNGIKNAFSDYWAVFFKLKRNGIINRSIISEFSWIHDGVSENLLTDFFKV